MAIVNVTTANTFEEWRVKQNQIGTAVGDIAEVTVSDIGATTLVAAVKAHQGIVVGSVTVSGSTMTGSLVFNDNAKVILGTSSDGLEIYHDGSNSYIADTGTGSLKVTAPSVDFSANVDVDGTLEADAITVNGVALATFVRDTVGTNMFTSNTESGIAVTYDTSNDNVDFALDAAQTTITSLFATDIKIGEDDQTKIDFETADQIHFYAANAEQVYVADGVFGPQTDSDVDLGTTGVRFKDAFVDAITVTGAVTANSLDIEGDVDVNGTIETDALTIAGISLSETIADTIGAMVTSNTESGIAVTYQDSDNTLDFDINDPTITLTGDVTGSATMTNLGSVSIATTRTAGSTSTADIADNAVTEAKVVNDAISRAKLKDEVSLLIINAAGSTVKTMYGAGS
jgi:hypothetical protein|tara:strand:+ start:1275 stop:2474 length:1200 start_codon:yes stop_codon:yes gene_type:complete